MSDDLHSFEHHVTLVCPDCGPVVVLIQNAPPHLHTDEQEQVRSAALASHRAEVHDDRDDRHAKIAERWGSTEADGLIESMYPEETALTFGRTTIGDRYRDAYTGFEGTAIAWSCYADRRVMVLLTRADTHGKPEEVWIAENRLAAIEPPPRRTGFGST